jgi:RNA polymerase sigma-70 factor (ECF subfamily)
MAQRAVASAASSSRPRSRARHARRLYGGGTPWPTIAALCAALNRVTPSIGVRVGEAFAVGEAQGAGAGLALLDALDEKTIATHQPYWAVRAHLAAMLGDTHGARRARERAIGLTEDPAIRAYRLARVAT